jgi:hypothetical protein
VVVFLLEATGLTFLIGLFPPLRAMWAGTAGFFGILVLYLLLLLSLNKNDREIRRGRERFAAAVDAPAPSPARSENGNGGSHRPHERHVAMGGGRSTRPSYNGLSVIDAEEVHVVVRPSRELEPAVR